ncbi:MAG: DNA recombination protein RmuC [Vicingaceae bacterium]
MDFIAVIIFISGLLLGFFAARFFNKKGDNSSSEELNRLQNENLSLKKDVEHFESRIKNSLDEFNKQKEREKELQEEKLVLNGKLSVSQTNLLNLEEKLNAQKEELSELYERFNKEFKLAANDILRQNSEDFSKAHQKELNELLNPLKEKIKSFESSVEKKYVDELKERSDLKSEIKQLMELNKTLNEQAVNLTTALKGENKTQGNWGEMVLERILESSGLIKGEEYETQFSDTSVDNKRIQPDVLIRLPDDKHIIVDAKVSLVAYEKFVSESDEKEKEKHLKNHIISVKSHVKLLSEKNYQSGIGVNSPDFVLLFMPMEPAFSLAMQNDPNIFMYAWDKKVVIVSPTTLLASLRTIASVWKHERQTKNALDIADRAGRLYDKFKGFVDDMQRIDKGLSAAKNAYDDAFNKLSTGKGNLVGRAEKIKALGAKTSKEIPKELIEELDDQE